MNRLQVLLLAFLSSACTFDDGPYEYPKGEFIDLTDVPPEETRGWTCPIVPAPKEVKLPRWQRATGARPPTPPHEPTKVVCDLDCTDDYRQWIVRHCGNDVTFVYQ